MTSRFPWGALLLVGSLALAPVVALSRDLTETQRASLAEHVPFGLPSTGELLFRKGYVASHNNWLKIPNWAAYHISSMTLSGQVRRANNFQADEDLKPWQRAERADYKGSGYDQGHMAPAAAMKRSEEAMSESFLLSNMVPQVGAGFNRGIWRILEDKVRGWALARGEGWVIVGPVFQDVDSDGVMSFKLMGKNRVAVPTHNFMILVTRDGQGVFDAIAFLLPNARAQDNDLSKYIVSIEEIEHLTGLDFLERLDDDLENNLEARRPHEIWSD